MIAGHRLPPCYRRAGRAALVSASAQCQWPVRASEAGAGHDYVAVVRERPHLRTPAALRRSGQAAEARPGWRRLAVLVQRQVWPRRRRLRWRSSEQAVSDACATRSMLWTALSARGLGHRPASLAFGTVHWRTRSRLSRVTPPETRATPRGRRLWPATATATTSSALVSSPHLYAGLLSRWPAPLPTRHAGPCTQEASS